MHIFIPAYVLLALASWSALAAPLSWSKRDNVNVAAQKHSSSSSILMNRQQIPGFGIGPIVLPQSFQPTSADSGLPISTMDCDSMSQSASQSTSTDDSKTDHDKTKDKTKDNPDPTTANTNGDPNATLTGPLPAIARRHFRSPMRRGSYGSPDIFERDEVPTTSGSGSPITVDGVLNFLRQRGAARKRARSPKTSRGFD